jgi:hypothetical protein
MSKMTQKDQSSEKNANELKLPVRILISIIAGFFTLISSIGKIGLILFDIFFPRGLRELVPVLHMYRKYTLTIANLFAGKKSKEIVEVSQELNELVLREQRMMKAYPLRRGFGEVINLAVTPIVFIAIPTAIGRIYGIKYIDLLGLIKDATGLSEFWSISLFGTGLLLTSWLATIFGPVYSLFHESSSILMKYQGYRWASIYQALENFFSLPYHVARSSFSFFDAPPISTETYHDFKLEIVDELNTIKNKVQSLLAMDSQNVPDRSKKLLENLLNEAELPLDELDISKIKEETARTFALLIWDKESSILPWKREKAREKFAKMYKMNEKEAKKSFQLIIKKLEEEFLSYDLYTSVIITGALKGIAKQEKKYKQLISDIEYNKLAIALALGAQQYIKDKYEPTALNKKITRKVTISLIAPFVPIFVLIKAIFSYFKHVILTVIRIFFSKRILKIGEYYEVRFQEISNTFTTTYVSVKKRGRQLNIKRDFGFDIVIFLKRAGRFLLKIILFVPLLIWSFFKSIYNIIKRIWTRASEEERMKRDFERDLATESLVSIYQEIYEKMLLSDLLIS